MARKSSRAAPSPSPAAKRRNLEQSPSPETKYPQDLMLWSERQLSVGGVRQLYRDTSVHGGIRVQVLGIYRYLADPALKERLGDDFAHEVQHDVFDLLLSDGRHKMKVVLWPAMNTLVCTRKLKPLDFVSVKKIEVINEDPEDEHQCQRVCVVRKMKVLESERPQVEKIVSSFMTASGEPNQLEFISTVHPREVELLPLAGERDYYLPLLSDDYTLDWHRSFHDGVEDTTSPLDELERGWAGRYLRPVGVDGAAAAVRQKNETPSVVWDSSQQYCSSLFSDDYKKIYTLQEASTTAQRMNHDTSSGCQYPPMIGVIQIKSKARHLGHPDVASPFPFAFNIVVVDRMTAVEVAFFGSMCARYFLRLQEGDIIQMRGYSVKEARELGPKHSQSDPVFCFEHDSAGSVFHVPAKYWKTSELTRVLAPPLAPQGQPQRETNAQTQIQLRKPCWMSCNFVTTLNTQYWSQNALENCASLYFDFVGVLSYVDKVCREHKRGIPGDNVDGDQDLLAEVQMKTYRWAKVIDSSSSQELVIHVEECSQPNVFQSLEAGRTFMVTKLKWVVLPATESESQIQYAATSALSVLRLDNAVVPFHEMEACSQNNFFAQRVNAHTKVEKIDSTGVSMLVNQTTKYEPRNYLPRSMENFVHVFGLRLLTFSELRRLEDLMEIFEHQHVGFLGRLRNLYREDSAKGSLVWMTLMGDTESDWGPKVLASENPLYHRSEVKPATKAITPVESLPLLRILEPAIADSLEAEATAIVSLTADSTSEDEDKVPSRPSRQRSKLELSLKVVEDYFLARPTEQFFFSLHLYRDAEARVKWTVDGIRVVATHTGQR